MVKKNLVLLGANSEFARAFSNLAENKDIQFLVFQEPTSTI